MQQEQTKSNANLVNLTNIVTNLGTSIKIILIKLDSMMQLPAVATGHTINNPTSPMCAAPLVRLSYNLYIPPQMPRPKGTPNQQPPQNDQTQAPTLPQPLTQKPMEVSDREKGELSPSQDSTGSESQQSTDRSTHT